MKLFVVVAKALSGENKGKLITSHVYAESESQLKRLLSIWQINCELVLISQEW